MYRLDRMRRDYKRFTAAEGYAIGFHVGNDVYLATMDEIPRRFTKLQKECSRNGGTMGLYINVKSQKAKKELLKKAIKVGTLEDITDEKYNKGVMFEKLIYQLANQPWKGKDAVPFYKDGDITINGKRIQVKYERARICYDTTLTRLKKELC